MARIALIAGMAAAGAVLSVMTGGLGAFAVGAWIPDIMAGLAAGAAVGETIGSLVFQPRTNGPRLADQQISNSANGSPIPFGYGGFRIAAQIIWSSGIVETATDQSQNSGKGMGSPTVLTYTYTIDFAAAFCEGPANVTRIWGDAKLIYDSTSKGAVTSDTFDTGLQNTGKQGGAQTTMVVPVVYTGTSTQMPDPTIQASEGIDQTPAFRDLCYIVYNGFPLADFGNRLPNIRGEISTSTTDSYVKDIYPPINLDVPTQGGGGTSVYNPTFCYVDPIGRAALLVDGVGATAERIDLATTNTEPLLSWQPATVYALGVQILDSAGNVETVTRAGTSGATQPVWVSGGETGITIDNSSVWWTNTGPGPEAILVTAKGILNPLLSASESLASEYARSLPLAGAIDTRGYFWACYEVFTSSTSVFYAVQFDATTFQAVARVALGAPAISIATIHIAQGDFVVVTTAQNFPDGGICYMIRAKGAKVAQQASWIPSTDGSSFTGPAYPAIDPSTGTVYIVTNPGPGSPYEWNITVLDPRSGAFIVSAFQFHGDATHGSGISAMFDPIDDSLIVFTDNGSIYKVEISSMTVVASAAAVVTTGGNQNWQFPKWNNGAVPGVGLFLAADTANHLLYINHSTLAIEQAIAMQSWFSASLGGGFTDAQLDPQTLSLVCTPSDEAGAYGSFAFRIYLNRQEVAGETLDQIVLDICERAGLSSSSVDVTALAGTTVLGYPVTRNGDAKSILVPLTAAFFFDAVESDFVLKFVPRGGAVAMTIPEADLGLASDGFELQLTIAQEHDLPKTIEVLYADPALDYQTGKQRASRPSRVVKTLTKSVLEFPITMNGDAAAQAAESTIRMIWNERNQYASKLTSPKYLVLDPTDVFEFIYEGNPYVARMVKDTIGQDLVTEFMACSEDPEGYIATAKANNGSGFPPQVLNPAAPTSLYLMDLPLLADTDNDPPGSTGYYFAMASASAGWPGGALFNSPDDQNFTQVGFAQSAIRYGSVGAATPAPPGPMGCFVLDTTTQIIVRIFGGGTVSSTTLLNVLNGANAFVLGDELIQFQTATLNADGSYTLSNLLRGRRGTDWAASEHVTGEVALFLPAGLHRNNVPVSLVGLAQFYQAVTIGQPRLTADAQPVTLEGNDLKPYSPCQIAGSRDGSGNLTVTWLRRTRIGGEQDWLDGVADVPLSEVSEAYSVDILNGSAVVRTFNGLTSPTVEYTAAEQVTDFGSDQPAVTVNVYQISADVGRGFAGVATV
jgi:hypothetical protein